MTAADFHIIIIAAAVCLASAVILWDRRRLRRIMRGLDEMLDAAIRDEFRETAFDESLRSSVETKLADYLTASAVSARRVRREKENIEALISDISHQTKTPLSNILLYTQLLSEQELPEPGRGGRGRGLVPCPADRGGAGGYVKVSSEPGKGAKFSLFLPRS